MKSRHSPKHFKPKDGLVQHKSLGQVFLNTQWPVEKLTDLLVTRGVQRVIEIGPGGGILTEQLIKKGIHVTAIEKDARFAEQLTTKANSIDPTKLVVFNEDILEFDLRSWIAENQRTFGHSPLAVVGNIPYYISTPIILWVLPHLHHLVQASFMVQLEFAQRVVAAVDTKSYGSLSVFCQLRAHCEFNYEVGRHLFTPSPKVDSAVFSLRPKSLTEYSETLLQRCESITRATFHLRRKKLRNSVKPFLKGKPETDCPIDLNRRAETLTPQEFIQLTKFLFPELT
jgi:16S rRNA (adenine1518-N6/adenine1519-N6)-dimethyltransferase